MSVYKADNGKVVNTEKMERVIKLSYEGTYGIVRCDLYRTKKSHQWYKISESSWCGNGSISNAKHMDLKDVASLIMEHAGESISNYPELSQYVSIVIDE